RKFCHKNIPLSSDQRNSPSRHYLNNCLSLTYSAQYCAQLITVDNLPFDTEYLGLNVISGSPPQLTEQSLVTRSEERRVGKERRSQRGQYEKRTKKLT